MFFCYCMFFIGILNTILIVLEILVRNNTYIFRFKLYKRYSLTFDITRKIIRGVCMCVVFKELSIILNNFFELYIHDKFLYINFNNKIFNTF